MKYLKPARPLTFIASIALVACGGGGSGNAPAPPPTATEIKLLAGHIGGPGNIDGIGNAARFFSPSAAVRAPSGEVYVADTGNHLIRRITPDGTVSTWAGKVVSQPGSNTGGYEDGSRLSARFNRPRGLALGPDGTLYVADSGNHLIRAISASGEVRTLAGQPSKEGSIDGQGSSATLSSPASLTMDAKGHLLFINGSSTLRTVTPQGEVSTSLARLPSSIQLTAVGLEGSGNLVVAGRFSFNSAAALYRVNADQTVNLIAGDPYQPGNTDGEALSARFGTVRGISADPDGNLLITDDDTVVSDAGRSRRVGGPTIRKLSKNGTVSTVAGTTLTPGITDGARTISLLCGPTSITSYDAQTWLVTDACNNAVRLVSNDGSIRTLAGQASVTDSTDGIGAQARFNRPRGVTTAVGGVTYVADQGNGAIRRIDADGKTTFLHNAIGLNTPSALATDASSTLCFSDSLSISLNTNPSVRCIGQDGVLRTLAAASGGAWTSGSGDLPTFGILAGITSDGQGSWLVTDPTNSALRSVSNSGVVSTPVKTIKSPGAITTAENGIVYLAVGYSIQMRQSDGNLKVVAGSPDTSGTSDGPATDARFGIISGLVVDAQNYIYVADAGTQTIRMVSPAGQVSTLAGTLGQTGVRLGNAPGSLSTPFGLALSADKNSLLVTVANGVVKIGLKR